MKKEYITSRLFKNHRIENEPITNKELCDLVQEQSSEWQDTSVENSQISKSDESQNEASLSQRYFNVLRKMLKH